MLWPLVSAHLADNAPGPATTKVPAAGETRAPSPPQDTAQPTRLRTGSKPDTEIGQRTEVARPASRAPESKPAAVTYPTADMAQKAPAAATDTAPDPPTQLSISGRILTKDGTPVPGVEVLATILDPSGQGTSTEPRRGRSNDAGLYEIRGLAAADYRLRTVETARYAPAGGTFRAGLKSADIVLLAYSTVQLYGRVTDASGWPIAGVEVSPRTGRDTVRVWTDDNGDYRTQLSVSDPAANYTVWFQHDDYAKERRQLRGQELIAAGEFRLDVALRAEAGTTNVSGTLRSSDGDPVPGERVQLRSEALDKQYFARSLPDGTFSMPGVEPDSDYVVMIHPKGRYESFVQRGLTIGGSTHYLDITLQTVQSGRLSGRMVDVDGYPVPGFSLLLKTITSSSSYIQVTADDGGYFVVEDAPAGKLMFVTRSDPRFVITGINLEPGASSNVELVIDWGDNELVGRVRDERRAPVTGARVKLDWQHAHGGTQSRSSRTTATDAAGYFRFSRLGPGAHLLEISAPGYQALIESHHISPYLGDIDVVLRRAN